MHFDGRMSHAYSGFCGSSCTSACHRYVTCYVQKRHILKRNRHLLGGTE
jgi:hypothetical protein